MEWERLWWWNLEKNNQSHLIYKVKLILLGIKEDKEFKILSMVPDM